MWPCTPAQEGEGLLPSSFLSQTQAPRNSCCHLLRHVVELPPHQASCGPFFRIMERDQWHSSHVSQPNTVALSVHTGLSALCAPGSGKHMPLHWPSGLLRVLGQIPSSHLVSSYNRYCFCLFVHFYWNVAFPAIFIFVFENSGHAKVPAHFLPGGSTE